MMRLAVPVIPGTPCCSPGLCEDLTECQLTGSGLQVPWMHSARLCLPQRRVVCMWFGALPGAFGQRGRWVRATDMGNLSADPHLSTDQAERPAGHQEELLRPGRELRGLLQVGLCVGMCLEVMGPDAVILVF